jgi:acetylornithine deacetylase/succinyl-diaminopimelate desuccinylase-like protein
MDISNERIIQIFKDMICLDTTNPQGNEVLMTEYISAILNSYEIPYSIVETAKGRTNLVASIGLEGGERPLVFISHVDVVSCEGQTWKHPPFSAIEEDGFIYGRGTLDTKHLTAMQLVAFVRASKFNLNRKVYFVASADEEKGSNFGMSILAKQFGAQFKDALVINEGGGFFIENANKPYYLCTVGEKGRCEVHVELEGDSGPASFKADNKVVDSFAKLLDSMSSFEFPLSENPVHKKFVQCLGPVIDNPILKNFERYNAHDACILQRYDIGNQINVLPYHIEFDFSLQLLPNETQADAEKMLETMFAGQSATYSVTSFFPGFATSCDNDFFKELEKLVQEQYGAVALLPVYALGRTDGRFLGPMPCDVYGFSPVTSAIDFSQVLTLVHQVNERIDRESVIKGANFFTDLLTTIGCKNHD